jgi:hypothetical protein
VRARADRQIADDNRVPCCYLVPTVVDRASGRRPLCGCDFGIRVPTRLPRFWPRARARLIELLLLEVALAARDFVYFVLWLTVRVTRRWLHTPSFATVSPQDISGSNPAEVQNFGKGSVSVFSSFYFFSLISKFMEMDRYERFAPH